VVGEELRNDRISTEKRVLNKPPRPREITYPPIPNSFFSGEGKAPGFPAKRVRRSCKASGKSGFSCTTHFQTPGSVTVAPLSSYRITLSPRATVRRKIITLFDSQPSCRPGRAGSVFRYPTHVDPCLLSLSVSLTNCRRRFRFRFYFRSRSVLATKITMRPLLGRWGGAHMHDVIVGGVNPCSALRVCTGSITRLLS